MSRTAEGLRIIYKPCGRDNSPIRAVVLDFIILRQAYFMCAVSVFFHKPNQNLVNGIFLLVFVGGAAFYAKGGCYKRQMIVCPYGCICVSMVYAVFPVTPDLFAKTTDKILYAVCRIVRQIAGCRDVRMGPWP